MNEPQARCELCGSECATSPCATCLVRYAVSRCDACGVRMVRLRERGDATRCSACRADAQLAKIPADVWEVVDGFLAKDHVGDAEIHLVEAASVSLFEAADLCRARLRHLRRTRPDEHPEPKPARVPTSEDVVRKARALGGRAVAIEAFWDGDTNGWFVVLCAILSSPSSPPDQADLAVLSGGGDIRLFNGTVPPWPEAALAAELGEAAAAELGVPFYFASPDKPDDSCPRWWERK